MEGIEIKKIEYFPEEERIFPESLKMLKRRLERRYPTWEVYKVDEFVFNFDAVSTKYQDRDGSEFSHFLEKLAMSLQNKSLNRRWEDKLYEKLSYFIYALSDVARRFFPPIEIEMYTDGKDILILYGKGGKSEKVKREEIGIKCKKGILDEYVKRCIDEFQEEKLKKRASELVGRAALESLLLDYYTRFYPYYTSIHEESKFERIYKELLREKVEEVKKNMNLSENDIRKMAENMYARKIHFPIDMAFEYEMNVYPFQKLKWDDFPRFHLEKDGFKILMYVLSDLEKKLKEEGCEEYKAIREVRKEAIKIVKKCVNRWKASSWKMKFENLKEFAYRIKSLWAGEKYEEYKAVKSIRDEIRRKIENEIVKEFEEFLNS